VSAKTQEELINTIGQAAGYLASSCEGNGLTVDENIAMLGLAAKILVSVAKTKEPGFDWQELGQRRLTEGFSQEMDIVLVPPTSGMQH
jgi:hypothetical protein